MPENNQTDPAARTERVLENNMRIEFTEQFAPISPEYTLEHVWGTTYSVSLSALLMTLFAMEGRGKVPDLSEGKTVNKAQQLEIMRRNLPKLTVLFQQGMIHQDANLPPEVLEMLMTSLQPQTREEGSFHPKVWLWAFKHNKEENNYVFRLLVTSRNLTQDTDFDAAVFFDSSREKTPENHHQKLFALFGKTLPTGWQDRLNKVTFSSGMYDMYEEIKRVSSIHTIVSPFLDAQAPFFVWRQKQAQQNKPDQELNLFSTKDALDSLKMDFERLGIRCFALRDLTEQSRKPENGEAPQDVIESCQKAENEEVPHVNLHAKLYFSDSYLFLGSRNCTYRGWHQNNEFMVRLNYGQKRDTLLNSLVYDPGSDVPQIRSSRNRTQALFEPYTPQFREPKKDDAENKRSALTEFLRTVACQVCYGDGTIKLALPDPPDNMPLQVVPFALQNNEDSWCAWQKGDSSWAAEEEQRSPFFCVRREDLSGFTAILIAEEKKDAVPLEKYVGRIKATFTAEEHMEYVCSLYEIPLDDIELVRKSEEKGSNSGTSWCGRDHRFWERLVQNVVVHPESAVRYRNELVNMKQGHNQYPGLDELIAFFDKLSKQEVRPS